MGAEESKPPEKFDSAQRIFSTEEQERLKIMFDSICKLESSASTKTQRQPCFKLDSFQSFSKMLPASLSQNLFKYMLQVLPINPKVTPQGSVPYHNYVISMSQILKGTASERAQLLLFLASENTKSTDINQMRELMSDFMKAFSKASEVEQKNFWHLPESGRTDEFVTVVLEDLQCRDSSPTKSSYEESDVEKWLSSAHLPAHVIDSVFSTVFPIGDSVGFSYRASSLLPQSEGAPWNKLKTLLDLPSLILLPNTLPPEYRSEWRFLFSSYTQGESFATLTNQIINKGPLLILVRDTDGHVFGGFTSINLLASGQFTGDETAFLFTLYPTMKVYHTSGINKNYLYYNKGQETLPNGLGMGGQFGYFGLWLDADYGKGHSVAQTTYNSPQLSCKQEFKIDRLEVWGVGPDPATLDSDDEGAQQQKSILDKDPEAKAILEMVNRGPISDGLREPDPMQQEDPTKSGDNNST